MHEITPGTPMDIVMVNDYWQSLERKEEEYVDERAPGMIKDIVDSITTWPEYKDAVFEEVVQRGRIPREGILFTRGDLRYLVDRKGPIEGTRKATVAIGIRKPRPNQSLYEERHFANNNPKEFFDYWLDIAYGKPGSQYRSSITYRDRHTPFVERSSGFGTYRDHGYADFKTEIDLARKFVDEFIVSPQ